MRQPHIFPFFILFSFLLSFSVQVSAERSPWYIKGAVDYSSLDIKPGPTGNIDFDGSLEAYASSRGSGDSATGYSFALGYQLNQYFGVELGYSDIDKFNLVSNYNIAVPVGTIGQEISANTDIQTRASYKAQFRIISAIGS